MNINYILRAMSFKTVNISKINVSRIASFPVQHFDLQSTPPIQVDINLELENLMR